ncbi:thiol-disulfide oxidoreductase DCC family protein [Sphingobium phenoxybenzoativorans]|uniref:Thiol-disulfide oxidoreductase DCC family protein n=2 Tax=Sphingobium phenoxybenzoativorans TaxID=1592790 RepID=A0A975Q468_9SPHN|nr:thiol-disulfide oxidoreductase DCC family protein [Sphingobium phenoxybenzoativorans]
MSNSNGPIIVFDAMCVLCSANAAFVLRHDRAGRFRLASMQGEIGAALYREFGIDPANPETLIVVENGRALRDSDAVLAIWAGLDRPWNGLATFRIVPYWLRDPAYRWIARHRYRLFGQRSTCWIPTPEQARRIL